MAKIKKIYNPSILELGYARYAINEGVAICIHPIPDRPSMYWVEKHRLDNYKKPTFLRKNVEKKDIPDNREVFSEIDAWKKVFEMYKLYYDKNN